jgi:hypothetical protein
MLVLQLQSRGSVSMLEDLIAGHSSAPLSCQILSCGKWGLDFALLAVPILMHRIVLSLGTAKKWVVTWVQFCDWWFLVPCCFARLFNPTPRELYIVGI